MLCGQHALNNLVQESRFSAGSLAEIAVRKTSDAPTEGRIPLLRCLTLSVHFLASVGSNGTASYGAE